MRALMGLIKDRHGTYCAQQKVPERLQAAVARVLRNGKPKQVYLKKSLGTKDIRTANVRAKPVQAGFDRVMRDAEAMVRISPAPAPRQNLNAAEIARMSEALYGKLLANDEAMRFGGRADVAERVAWMRQNENPNFVLPYRLEDLREYGWTPEQLRRQKEHLVHELETMREALALGDITAVEDDVALLLADFEIQLEHTSASYRELGKHALRAYVRALEAIEQRNAGEPINTPTLPPVATRSSVASGDTLRDAADGWERQRVRPPRTVHEFRRSVEMFVHLHGNLQVVQIRKSHVREFRDALSEMPRLRQGKLLKAPLPELQAWGRAHPEARKISNATINKQLTAVEAVAVWAHDNGLIPDDIAWSDPFSNMRLPEEGSEREPFDTKELQKIFNAPIFTKHELPLGAKGPAGFWLPLLALFTGARQAELGGLKVSNVQSDDATGTPLLFIVSERKAGKKLKTRSSERAVPLHELLISLGFLDFVADRHKTDGENAWLFPAVAPDQPGALPAWSKWFGRYLRDLGVVDTNKVFHSFRHGFKDAARAAGVPTERHDALTGHSMTSTVSGSYGAKKMIARFGVPALKETIAKIAYPGLDLSRVQPFRAVRRKRGTKEN